MIQGTQTLSSEQQRHGEDGEKQPVEKEEFNQSPTSQSAKDGTTSSTVFDENQDGLNENQIQNMTREAGDGQQNDGGQSNNLE